MNISLDIQIQAKDLYRFQMRQAYRGMQGWISILISLLMFVMAGVTVGESELMYTLLYCGAGVLFLVYVPVSLWFHAKTTMKTNQVLSGMLHYEIGDAGIHVVQGEEEADLPWNLVYKCIGTKKQVLIFSNRVSAFILPRPLIEEQYEDIKGLAVKHLEKYRVKFCD